MSKRRWYIVHRWLGLIVSLQLLAWSVGGFMFSILDIDDVRGDLNRSIKSPPGINTDRLILTVADALARAKAEGVTPERVTRAVVRTGPSKQTVFELFGADNEPIVAVDGTTAAVTKRISEEEAKRAALSDFAGEARVASIALLTDKPPQEYRSSRMPIYQIVLDHPKQPHIYVCPVTSEVLKRRNKLWRTFDFFWMLHIMDYRNRESFNHWLLTTMSALAILTSASGLVLWWWRLPRLQSRRERRAASLPR